MSINTPRIVLIDHYDSFTYTIKAYFEILGCDTEVILYDKLQPNKLTDYRADYIVLSPGPGHPRAATQTLALLQWADLQIPILGICLGMQCLVEAFGGRVIHAPQVMHGKQSLIAHSQSGLFQDIPQYFSATRYHSLMVDDTCIPTCLKVTARTADETQIIMAIEHRDRAFYGVQYHPEAILTEHGLALFANFLSQNMS